MAINPIIKQKAEDIRKKIFGSEVRESLASGIEAISEDVEATIGRQDYVEEQFQDVLDETTGKDVISAPELIAARNGKSNLKTRLDDEHAQVTAQLQQTENDMNARGLSPSSFGVIADGTADTTTSLQAYVDYCIDNNKIMALNGTFLTKGLTFKGKGKIVGDAIFKAIDTKQPFVIKTLNRIEWTGKLLIDGLKKALYGFVGEEMIHSHYNDVEVTNCLVWGFTFLPAKNNGMVSIDKFRGFYNGQKHNTNFTVANIVQTGGISVVTVSLDTPIDPDYIKHFYDCIYVIYKNRPYRVHNNGSGGGVTLDIRNLPELVGFNGNIDVVIGGAVNIPSYGDNGVGNWGVMDIFANAVGINSSGLYGHTFSKPVIQGNAIGLACENIVENLSVNSPYFEENVVDVVTWSYIKGMFINPIMEYHKIFSLNKHKLYGHDYLPELNILHTYKSPNMSDTFSSDNPGNLTVFPSKHYAYNYNSNQTAKTFTIKNDIIYENTHSNYIYMTLNFAAGSDLTFKLANQNGDTVEGLAEKVEHVQGTVLIVITKVVNDWKINVFKKQQTNAAKPNFGTYKKGDYVENSVPTENGAVGSKYVVYGWKRLTDGAAHIINVDWVEDRRFTGN